MNQNYNSNSKFNYNKNNYNSNYNNKNQSSYFGQTKTYAKNYNYNSKGDQYEDEDLVEDMLVVPVEKLKNYCLKDKENIKVVSLECKTDPTIMVVDISMNPKGRDEELVYLANPEYVMNIRRGNTLLEFYFEDKRNNSYQLEGQDIGRKGMMKFTDLPFETIEMKDNHYMQTRHINDETKLNSRKIIFGPVFRSFSSGHKVELIKLIKANGENAQISYNKNAKMWVIASKNVSLLARNRQDLYEYTPSEKSRYSFAYIIGHCWFDILDNVTASSPHLLREMQNFLNDHTMVGEYVGNQNHQHLIRYLKHTILFFGIVNNYSSDNSLPVYESYKKFQQFKLDVVPFEKIGIFTNHKNLCEALEKLYIRIAESSIIDEEEGSVLYLIDKDDNRVLSLCKLKTLEYRVYRKLREKLKNHLLEANEKNNFDSRRKINQFFDEVRQMLQGYTLPMPMNFYYKVAETAFSFLNKYPDACQDLHSYYIDFLEVIHAAIDQTVDLKSRVIKKDNIMTYDFLLKNELKSKKVIEIIIYAPPLYLPEEFLKTLEKTFNTELRNSFVNNFVDVNNDILIYHINMHNFRSFNKLEENKFIFVFGMNDPDLKKKCLESINEKLANPQFISYNKNNTLTPFLINKSENLETTINYYIESSKEFVEKTKKYIGEKMIIYDTFQESNPQTYILDIEKQVKVISNLIKNINPENIKTEGFFYEDLESTIKQNKSTNEKEKKSKYKNNRFINLYEDHVNPFQKWKEAFLKEQSIKIANIDEKEKKIENDISMRIDALEVTPQFIDIDQNKTQSESMLIDVNFKDTQLFSNSNDVNKKEIVILIPMTIPGTGKTYFVDGLKQILFKTNIYFDSISSDTIRRKIMDNLMNRNPRLHESEAFERSGKPAIREFENELINKFNTLANNYVKSLLYIDKNHPPNAISRVFETIRGQVKNMKDVNVKFVALLPDCQHPLVLSKTKKFPFSLAYFLQCYVRIKNRRDHPTLNGTNNNLLSILTMFINNFINFDLNEQNLILHYEFNRAIKLPFTEEFPNEDLKIPNNLLTSAINYFDNIVMNNNLPANDQRARNFEELINKIFPNPQCFKSTKEYVKETGDPIIRNLYCGVITNPLTERKIIIEKPLEKIVSIEPSQKIINNKTNRSIFNQEFNYLCLAFTDHQDLFFKEIIVKALNAFLTIEKDIHKEVKILLENIQLARKNNKALSQVDSAGWTVPKHQLKEEMWHITTLYKGKNPIDSVKSNPSFLDFDLDKKVPVTINGLVYVPEKIMTCFCQTDAVVENIIPHATTLLKGYTASKSNDMLVNLFGEGGKLEKEFKTILNNPASEQDFIQTSSFRSEGFINQCYIYKFNPPIKTEAIMKAFK